MSYDQSNRKKASKMKEESLYGDLWSGTGRKWIIESYDKSKTEEPVQ